MNNYWLEDDNRESIAWFRADSIDYDVEEHLLRVFIDILGIATQVIEFTCKTGDILRSNEDGKHYKETSLE